MMCCRNFTMSRGTINHLNAFFFLALIFPNTAFAEEVDKRLVSELTIEELTETVRKIVEESIEKCTVAGTMEGRARVNLVVEGEVVAKMECDFEEPKNPSNEN